MKTGKELSEGLKNIVDGAVGKDTLFFAKTVSSATIPTKRKEDAGYDVYASVKPRETAEGLVYEQYLEKGEVSTINTGIASAMSKDYFLSLKLERSSIGKHGIAMMAGTIDSGYRGEIKLMVIPMLKNILISSMVNEVEVHDDMIIIPYKKAIAQAVLLPVPDVEVKVIPYRELKEMSSERGTGGWGSTDKK